MYRCTGVQVCRCTGIYNRGARTTRRGNLARTSDKARRARIIDAARRAARAHGTRNGTRHDARARTTRRGPASAPCSKNQSIRLLGCPHNSLFPSSTKRTARPAPAVPYSLGGVTIEKPPVDKAHCALYMGQPEYPTPLRVDLTRKTRKKRLKQTQSGPAEKNSTGGGRLTDVYSSFSAVYRICERAQRPLSRHRLPREWCTSG